jgi:hypothetical protein
MHTKFWSEKLKGRYHLEERYRWEENIRMHLTGNRVRRCGLDASGSAQGPVAGCCEHRNEPSDSIKGREFS